MATNKAAVIAAPSLADPASAIKVQDLAVPEPGAGEVVVRLTLRPVNPADVFTLMGVYPGHNAAAAAVPVAGLEGTGVVHALGAGATKFSVGQRVTAMPFPSVIDGVGTWQQYLAVPEAALTAVPDAVTEEAAAQAYVNPVTVVGMLRVLSVPKGKWLLQTAAGSVLGRQMIQYARHKGVKTINVVRRAELADELKALGADEVVVWPGEDLAARVKEITGGAGAYAAIDAVGEELFSHVASAVRNGGTAMIYGAMSGLSASFSIPDPLFRGVTMRGFWLHPWLHSMTSQEREGVKAEVMELLAGVLTPYSGAKFPLEEAAAAVAASQQAARGGKVFLEG